MKFPDHSYILVVDQLSYNAYAEELSSYEPNEPISEHLFLRCIIDSMLENESVCYKRVKNTIKDIPRHIETRILNVFGNTLLIYGYEREEIYSTMVNCYPHTHFLLFPADGLVGSLTPEMYSFFLVDYTVAAGDISSGGIIIKR